MTDLQKTIHAHLGTLSSPSLWTRGLAFLGGMGVLSSSLVLAQTPTPPVQPIVPATTEAVPVEGPSVPPAAVTPEPIAPPGVVPAPIAPPEVAPTAPSASQAPASNPSGAYIDTTRYNLGATEYQPPSSVVLTERSTGCQTVVQNGQGVGRGCASGVTIPSRDTAQGDTWVPRPREANWASYPTVNLPQSPASIRVGSLAFSPYSGNPFSVLTYYKRTPQPTAMLGNGNRSLLFPLTMPATISSLFGWRTHPISGNLSFHSGTDLAAPMGTPVVAAFEGRVAIADFLGGYGLTIVLDHPDPANKDQAVRQTLYGHLSEIFVQPGDLVKQGAVIGRVGSTGNSTGPHLHFEVREMTPDGWVAINPGVKLETALNEFLKGTEVADLSLRLEMSLGGGPTIALDETVGGSIALLPTTPTIAALPGPLAAGGNLAEGSESPVVQGSGAGTLRTPYSDSL